MFYAMDWLGFFVPRFGWRRQPTESLNEPHPDDLDRLEELRMQGSRMELPHPVRAYLVFPEEQAARDAGEILEKEGFSCALRSGGEGAWVVTAITRLIPTPGAVTKLREQAEALAAASGGAYKGWDAPAIY